MRVGLIVNPVSSKDIRRLTGLARVIDAEEKANLMARLLVGLAAAPGTLVLAMDDRPGLVRRAVYLAHGEACPVEFLPIDPVGDESDTRKAAAMLSEMGVSALVTVGGDGTVRSAVEGWPGAPLVPVAAGTNNAFALSHEPTVLGFALARCLGREEAFIPTTAVRVDTGTGSASSVIDVVSVKGRWVGSGAVWEPAQLIEAVVTTARPTSVGVASVSAGLGPLKPGHARWIRFGHGTSVPAVSAPGLIAEVPVERHSDHPIGARLSLDAGGGVLALDGERRLVADEATVEVVEGPRVFDPEQALRM